MDKINVNRSLVGMATDLVDSFRGRKVSIGEAEELNRLLVKLNSYLPVMCELGEYERGAVEDITEKLVLSKGFRDLEKKYCETEDKAFELARKEVLKAREEFEKVYERLYGQ